MDGAARKWFTEIRTREPRGPTGATGGGFVDNRVPPPPPAAAGRLTLNA